MRPVTIIVRCPVVVCRYLIGREHSHLHRLICGLGVACVGVAMVHIGSEPGMNGAVAFVLDIVGWTVHGVGVLPYMEALVASIE